MRRRVARDIDAERRRCLPSTTGRPSPPGNEVAPVVGGVELAPEVDVPAGRIAERGVVKVIAMQDVDVARGCSRRALHVSWPLTRSRRARVSATASRVGSDFGQFAPAPRGGECRTGTGAWSCGRRRWPRSEETSGCDGPGTCRRGSRSRSNVSTWCDRAGAGGAVRAPVVGRKTGRQDACRAGRPAAAGPRLRSRNR